jgi:hypothetical protein
LPSIIIALKPDCFKFDIGKQTVWPCPLLESTSGKVSMDAQDVSRIEELDGGIAAANRGDRLTNRILVVKLSARFSH